MQRLHEQDPTGEMLSKRDKKIKHICLPAENKGNVLPPELADNYVGGLLDPVRLDAEVLAESKTDLGSFGYAGQFDQKPAPDEGGIFKRDLVSDYRLETGIFQPRLELCRRYGIHRERGQRPVGLYCIRRI